MNARRLLEQAPHLLTEKDLSSLVVDIARLAGWRRYHTFDSRRSTHGFPDWIFVKGARLLAVELKSEQGNVRPEQREWLDALGEVESVRALVWRPSDWDLIVETLTGRQLRQETEREG